MKLSSFWRWGKGYGSLDDCVAAIVQYLDLEIRIEKTVLYFSNVVGTIRWYRCHNQVLESEGKQEVTVVSMETLESNHKFGLAASFVSM